jgi:hypothetical protein
MQSSGDVMIYLSYPTFVGHIHLTSHYLLFSFYEGYYGYVLYSFK